MTDPIAAIEYTRQRHDAYVAELKEFMSIPSISALSEYIPDMHRAAD
jgi:hypothetical protein